MLRPMIEPGTVGTGIQDTFHMSCRLFGRGIFGLRPDMSLWQERHVARKGFMQNHTGNPPPPACVVGVGGASNGVYVMVALCRFCFPWRWRGAPCLRLDRIQSLLPKWRDVDRIQSQPRGPTTRRRLSLHPVTLLIWGHANV